MSRTGLEPLELSLFRCFIYRLWLELRIVFLGHVGGVTRPWEETLTTALANADRLQPVTASSWSCLYFWMDNFEQNWTVCNSTGTGLERWKFTANSECKLRVELDWNYPWFFCFIYRKWLRHLNGCWEKTSTIALTDTDRLQPVTT